MNMHALLLHVLGDALGNVGVIATGLIIWLTEWKYKFYCDPVISLVITIIIFSSALPLGEYPIYCIMCPCLPVFISPKRVFHIIAGSTINCISGRSPKLNPRCRRRSLTA